MNEYLYEIMNETELTAEEMMYASAYKTWRKNLKKRQEIEESENAVDSVW